jgi:predicted nuclease of restriction endonuclease-like (RecB) superfamily
VPIKVIFLLSVIFPMPKEISFLPDYYDEFFQALKEQIRLSQIRAAIAVNQEMILLYWQIGREILERQQQEGWGAKVIERLSIDLRLEFPDIQSFSPRNIKYMRTFAEAYPDEQFVKQVVSQIPWGHNIRLLNLVKVALAIEQREQEEQTE